MKKILIDKNWKMRRTDEERFYGASVPGSVYRDLLNAGQMEDPFWKDNETEALKLMDHDYEYSTTFICDDEMINMSRCDSI